MGVPCVVAQMHYDVFLLILQRIEKEILLFFITVIFTMHRKRNVVIFYINFSFMKVFKKKKIIADFFKPSFACVLIMFSYFIIRL